MPSSHLILCHPLLLLPPIPPSIRVFSNELTLHMRWLKNWSFSFNISPSNEHPGLISFVLRLRGKKSELEILGFSVFAIVVLVFLMCKLNPHKMCRYVLKILYQSNFSRASVHISLGSKKYKQCKTAAEAVLDIVNGLSFICNSSHNEDRCNLTCEIIHMTFPQSMWGMEAFPT